MTAITPPSPRMTIAPLGHRLDQVLAGLGTRAEALGSHALRYGLVLILLWIGAMKFTAYEAEGIRPFVENSPLFAWTYPVFGVQGLSNLLGVTEILVGLLIAVRPWFPRVSAVGSLLAVGMFPQIAIVSPFTQPSRCSALATRSISPSSPS